MSFRKVLVIALLVSVGCFGSSNAVNAQAMPTQDQLKQLVAPFALFPDALVAQICAASTDPQQILDVHDWMMQNGNLQGQALTDAAQQHGFDPAFVSLVNFPTVIDMMANNIDDYAALGDAFRANQQPVMAAIQTLRQDAFARGALDSNEYQTVSVQQQGNVQVVVVQPTNPQVVFVPQYQPQQVWASGPSTGDMIAASMVSFGAGIALGAWLNNSHPWGWGGWGWGWGGRGMVVQNNVWVVNNRWHSPRNNWRPGPPRWNRPVYARPPSNWNQRPGWRPPPSGWRPNGPNYRPGGGNRPPTNPGFNRPPGGNTGGNRPGGNPGGNTGGNRPGGNPGGGNAVGNRPPGGNTGGNRPGGNPGGTPGNRPGGNTPGNPGGGRPGGNPGNAVPGGTRPPGNAGTGRPPANAARPPANNTRPARNPYAGFPQGGGNRPQGQPQQRPQGQPQQRPQGQPQQRPQSRPQTTGARPGGFGGNNNGGATRAASNRGRASAGGGGNRGGRR